MTENETGGSMPTRSTNDYGNIVEEETTMGDIGNNEDLEGEKDMNQNNNGSSNSSESKLSIRIPRKAVSGETTPTTVASTESVNKGNDHKMSSDEEHQSSESNLEVGERKEKSERRKKETRPLGRKRRGAESDESAYSEDSEPEESESEEVYSDEDDDDDEEEYEVDEDDEEWDERRQKYVRKERTSGPSVYRNYNAPTSVPFQYSTSMGMGYAPIQPLPASMANIPMFAKLAQSQAIRPAIPGGAPQMPMVPMIPASQLQEIVKKAITDLASSSSASSQPVPQMKTGGETNPGDSKAKEQTEGSVPPPTSVNPAEAVTATELKPQVSAELKNALLNQMMSTPEWRAALLQKLQQNRAISAEQAAKMGIRPVTTMSLPPGAPGISLRPMAPGPIPMMPMGYQFHPQMMRPPSIPQYRPRPPKPPKSKKSKVSPSGSEENVPIASRRPRRTEKKVNYKEFYVDDEEESEVSEMENSSHEGERSGTATPKPRKSLTPKRPLRRNVVDSEEEDFEEELGSDEEMMNGSKTSDDVGVEKILSHRVVDGKSEFLVKFHNLSYIHAEWISEEEMLRESNGASRIKRFLSKPLSMRHYSDKHPFNPEYTQIDRIIYGWKHPVEEDSNEMTSSYLVKWMGLPYCEATWEKESAILELPDGSEKLKSYLNRPTLSKRQSSTVPPGYRPDREKHQNMTESPTYKGENALRSYQLEGVNWLVYCWVNRQSCIIADEMGLGKTVQSVAFLDLLYNRYNVRGPFLIVAPLSTIPHWEREFESWTDLNVIVYHGNIPSRDTMNEYEFYYKTSDDKIVPGYCKFDVLITTYEMALAGFEHLQPIMWRAAIFDEAHRLKNRASKASETLKALQVEHKVLLTGTPLQNNIEELWSLLNFLQPNRFYSESNFVAEYGNLKRSEDVIKLQELLKPLMLRRLKEDVEKSIPVKEETVIEVELTSVQKRYYRAILEKNFAFLTKGCRGTNAPNLINAMMELRKCCIHPYLIKGAEERIQDEFNAKSLDEQMICMIQASGKLVLVDKLLKRLRENGHKVLIFSQMTRCLDILVDYLKWRGYPFERIDGAIKGELRQAAIDRYCDPSSDSFIFLLCTRAGGVGINLTAADTVVIFDSDWNPQNDIQAQARCHRIGQTKSVKVYRLLTRNTYEREMFDKAGMKLGLDRAVLRKILPNETLEGASHNPQLSKKEVETLLKKGAYGLLMENDEDSIKFCEEDIDQILARRTTVIRHGEEARAAAAEGSIFSKASFAATADDMDIDIDDPNFWELWARRLDLDPRQLLSSSGVVVDEPRIKRQARRLRSDDLNVSSLEKVLDETIENSTNNTKPPTNVGEPNLWSDKERCQYIKELLLLGTQRYDEMRSKFPNRSKNDLIACSRAIIKLCLEEVQEDEDIRLREDNEKLLLAHLDFDRSEIGNSEIVDESTGKIDLAAAELQTEEPNEPTLSTKEFHKADIPFSGASRRQIFEFRSFLRQAPENLISSIKMVAKQVLLRLQLLDFIRQLVEGHSTVVKKGKKNASDEIHYQLPVPNIIGTAPVKGWGKAEDEALVLGIYKSGFGLYEEVRKNEVFSFINQNEELTWPEDSVLLDRLKKVVLAMEKKTQAAAKLAIQALQANENTSGGRRRKNAFEDDEEMYEEEYAPVEDRRRSGSKPSSTKLSKRADKSPALSIRWSKRDRGEFQRVVMSFGLPPEIVPGRRDWSQFKQIGSFANTILRASDKVFDEYCDLFVKGCHAVTEKRGKRESFAADEEEEYLEEAEDDDLKATLPLIPLERAKKALSKIELFDKLRKQILTLSDLEGYFERSRKTSGLPGWWETPAHDVALLRAVGKYGFGQWELVVKDEELPFRAIFEQFAPEEFSQLEQTNLGDINKGRGRRKKTTNPELPNSKLDLTKIQWPLETTLTRRVETLIEMAQNEERRRAAASLAQDDGSPRKKRRSIKLNIKEDSVNAEDPPSKRRKKQKSLLEFGVKKKQSESNKDNSK